MPDQAGHGLRKGTIRSAHDCASRNTGGYREGTYIDAHLCRMNCTFFEEHAYLDAGVPDFARKTILSLCRVRPTCTHSGFRVAQHARHLNQFERPRSPLS